MSFILGNELDIAKDADLITKSVQNICWLMAINRNFSVDVRQAFMMAFDTDVYQSALPNGFSAAKSIYPKTLGINADGIGVVAYNIDNAKTTMSAQISKLEDKKFPQSTMYYYNEDGVKGLATAIVGHWQQNLSTFINIESTDNIEVIKNEIAESTLDFALFPITSKSAYFNEYAKNFAARSVAATPDALQQELLSDYSIVPVAYQTTNISYVSSLKNVSLTDDNGYIDFSHIIKE